MFRAFEIYLLTYLGQFVSSAEGTAILMVLGFIAIILQFIQGKNGYWFAGFGVLCFLTALFQHLHGPEWSILIENFTIYLDSPRRVIIEVPVLESALTHLIAPASKRFAAEEMLGIFVLLYLTFVGLAAFEDFSKTKKIFDLSELNVKDLFAKSHKRPIRSKTNELGSGDLASHDQVSKWLKPTDENDTVFEIRDLRGSKGSMVKSGKLYIPREKRNRHMLIIAKTGGGKTTKMILPVLYNDCMSKTRSTIVMDSKPEMWRKLAAMTRAYNPTKKVLRFNPLELSKSLSWNILSKIDSDTDCKLIANTIVMATDNPTAKSDSPFFRNNALALLNAIMVGLLEDQKGNPDKGKDPQPNALSMPNVHRIIQSGMKPLCNWLETHEGAIRTTRTFVDLVRSGSQNADTIMSELSMRVSAWDLKQIRTTTGLPELDLDLLIKEPTLLIVELRESELEMLRPLANVIVVELLRFLTKRAESYPGGSLPRPVGLVIDEFASALGKLPDIEVKLNTLRSRNVSIVAAIQSTAQVKALYDTHADSVLSGFNTKIFMPILDFVDSEFASKESGQMTVRFRTASLGSNKRVIDFFAQKNDSTNEQVQQRAVLTPDEIGRPADGINTFFMPDTPVFQGFLIPWYELPELRDRISAYDKEDKELKIRNDEIPFDDTVGVPISPAAPSYTPGGLPPGISNTIGWSDAQLEKRLAEVKKKLDWDNCSGAARKWWDAFESENTTRKGLIVRLAEELSNRKATISEFFLGYVYSNTENIQANLHYLDYTRLKKDEEKRKKEATEKAGSGQDKMAAA